MTERVLPYDHAIVPQETGWWCGPAATQVVLNSRGILLEERDIANAVEQLENPGRGDDRDGTDYVGLLERYLDGRVPDAKYSSVYTERDPMTAAQKDALWKHVVASIDAGWGVIMNWVAPPGNKPRGVKGSVSPSYSSGTTYHYVACMGYDDAGARALWIADSGFRPYGYWVSFDQAATLIPPKGYAYAAAAPAGPPPPAPGPDPVTILSQAMGGSVSRERYAALLPAVSDALNRSDCRNVNRIAMWCAQIGHESVGLKYMKEIGDAAYFAKYNNRADLGNGPTDGPRYPGRGPIQVTGRSNYRQLSRWAFDRGYVPSPTFFEDQPEQLELDRYAFLGAIWYWTVARPDINALSDKRDVDTVTRRINGGTNGLADRRARYDRALKLGDQLLVLAATPPADPIEELLMQELESWSIYATPGEPKIPAAKMLQAIDAAAHRELVERAARLGDTDSLARIARTAKGLGKYRDPAVVEHAIAVLADIGGKTKDEVRELLKG